jgi:hypothetical protein
MVVRLVCLIALHPKPLRKGTAVKKNADRRDRARGGGESIMEGRQPASLTAEALTRHIEIPLEWCSQKTALKLQ